MAKAIGFRGRGENRSIGTPFDIKSEDCRLCGGCIYVCPACQLRCTYTEPDKADLRRLRQPGPPCVEKDQFDDMMCYMDPCVACEIETKNHAEEQGVRRRCHDILQSQHLGRNPDQEPDRGLGHARLGHVRHLRGRLHRHVRDRQVRLPRPRGDLPAALRRDHHRRREGLPRRLLALQHHGHRRRRPRHRGRQRQGHLPQRQPGGRASATTRGSSSATRGSSPASARPTWPRTTGRGWPSARPWPAPA